MLSRHPGGVLSYNPGGVQSDLCEHFIGWQLSHEGPIVSASTTRNGAHEVHPVHIHQWLGEGGAGLLESGVGEGVALSESKVVVVRREGV